MLTVLGIVGVGTMVATFVALSLCRIAAASERTMAEDVRATALRHRLGEPDDPATARPVAILGTATARPLARSGVRSRM